MESTFVKVTLLLAALILLGLAIGQVYLFRGVSELKELQTIHMPVGSTGEPTPAPLAPRQYPTPAPRATKAPDVAHEVQAVDRFISEQRKIDAYQAAKLDYILDSVRMLEALALLDDAVSEQERRRLQVELDEALTRRADSRDKFERATSLYGEAASAAIRRALSPPTPTPTQEPVEP